MLEILIFGAVTSAIYAMLAVGFTLIFGVARILNLAHGSFYALGAYGAYVLTTIFKVPLLVAAPLGVVGVALFGMVVERVLIRPMRTSQLAVLMISLAVSLIVEQALFLIFGSEYRNVPSFIDQKYVIGGVDVAVLQVSPPDRHGYFSLGTNVDCIASFVGRWPICLEVNEQMPRTFGRNSVHVSQVVGWSLTDRPLVEVPPVQPDALDHSIAALIAERVPDRATVQAGIGSIPNAVLAALGGHKDLGVHTEMFSDGVVELVERDVITNARKTHRPVLCRGLKRLSAKRPT